MPPEHSHEPKGTTSRFEKLLADLARAKVDFAVVGGLAVILNGYPRLTLDADILVADAPENIRRLLDCLATWGEGWSRELSADDFSPQEGSIRVTEDFDLDIFTRMRGNTLADFRARLRHFESGGAQIPYLAPQDLVLLKQLDVAAMREILQREAKH